MWLAKQTKRTKLRKQKSTKKSLLFFLILGWNAFSYTVEHAQPSTCQRKWLNQNGVIAMINEDLNLVVVRNKPLLLAKLSYAGLLLEQARLLGLVNGLT